MEEPSTLGGVWEAARQLRNPVLAQAWPTELSSELLQAGNTLSPTAAPSLMRKGLFMLTYQALKLPDMPTPLPQPNSNKAANWVKKHGYGTLLQLAFALEETEVTYIGMSQATDHLQGVFPDDLPLVRGMLTLLLREHLVLYSNQEKTSIMLTRKACELLRHHGHPTEKPQRRILEHSGPVRLIYKSYPGLKHSRHSIEIDMLSFEVRNENSWKKIKKALNDPRFHERYNAQERLSIEADARRFYEQAMHIQFGMN